MIVLLQTIYECSECIVERESEDGSVDIPQGVFPAAPAPIVIEQPPVLTPGQPQLYATPAPMACNVYSTSYQY